MASLKAPPTPSCHVVAVPYPGRGHINPMISLCTAVAEHSSDVLVTVVLTEEWLGLLGSVTKPPNVSFAAIPNVVPSEKVRGDDLPAFATAVMTKMVAPFEQLVDGGALRPPDFIISDALMSWVHEAAGRRNIPSAHLWTMSAAVYSVFYHFDLLVKNGHYPVDLSVNGEAMVDYIPGLPPTRVADLPLIINGQEIMPKLMQILPTDSNSKHLIFTSFYALESQVLAAIKQQLPTISIYTIGPAAVHSKLKEIKTSSAATPAASYLTWLDRHPPRSVLYVSLGSFLHVSTAQMEEIAAGLKESGVTFLWVARRDSPRLNEIFGNDGKGLVVEWCDQLRVLSHPSVGGFLSHCGWNSTKEAALTGVPVLTFPLIMDQLADAKAIVEDWRIGLRVLERGYDEEDLKRGDEIAVIVKRFMDLESVERKEIDRNARELQNKCDREFAEGESHQANLSHFVRSIKSCCTQR